MNFEDRQLSCNKDIWIKFIVLLLKKFISQMVFCCCGAWLQFKTVVKLNLLDGALNLALDRLNLTFSIEIFRFSATFAKVEVGIYLKTLVNLLLKALKLTY